MFKNIGNKIKVWAKVDFVITLLAAALMLVVGSIVILFSGTSALNLVWLLLAAIGCAVAGLITSYYIYGFGSIVAARTSIKNKLNAGSGIKEYSVSLGTILAWLSAIFSVIVTLIVFFARSALFFRQMGGLEIGGKFFASIMDMLIPLVVSLLVTVYCILFLKGTDLMPILGIAAMFLFVYQVYVVMMARTMDPEVLIWIIALAVFACGSFKPSNNERLIRIFGGLAGVFGFASVFTSSISRDLALIPALLLVVSFVRTKYIIDSK